MGMEYDRLHLRVNKIWQDQEGESLLIDFDGAGLVVYCVYSFEPLQVDLEDLVGQTVKELEESEFKYTITFTNGSKLQLEPISDKFIFAPEALIYHNNSFYPPLEVVIDKIEQDAR